MSVSIGLVEAIAKAKAAMYSNEATVANINASTQKIAEMTTALNDYNTNVKPDVNNVLSKMSSLESRILPYASNTLATIVSGTGSTGQVILRPRGSTVATGQAVINNDGSMTVNGDIFLPGNKSVSEYMRTVDEDILDLQDLTSQHQSLLNDIVDVNDTQTALINTLKTDVNTINTNVTGLDSRITNIEENSGGIKNKSFTITKESWVENQSEQQFEYTLTHDMGSTDILFTAINTNTKEYVVLGASVVDSNTIKFKTTVTENLKIVLNTNSSAKLQSDAPTGDLETRVSYLEENLIYPPEDTNDTREPEKLKNLIIVLENQDDVMTSNNWDINFYDILITQPNGKTFDFEARDYNIVDVVKMARSYTWGYVSNQIILADERTRLRNADERPLLGPNGNMSNVYGNLNLYKGSVIFYAFDKEYDIANIKIQARSYSDGMTQNVKMKLYTVSDFDSSVEPTDDEFLTILKGAVELKSFDNDASPTTDIAYMYHFEHDISPFTREVHSIWEEVNHAKGQFATLKEAINFAGLDSSVGTEVYDAREQYFDGNQADDLYNRLYNDFDEVMSFIYDLQSYVSQLESTIVTLEDNLVDVARRVSDLENAR